MQRYMIRPLQHGLDLSHSSLNAPFPYAYWPSRNFKVTQHSAQKRWGYDNIDRQLGDNGDTDDAVQAIVLYQMKVGTRFTLYLTATDLIKKTAGSATNAFTSIGQTTYSVPAGERWTWCIVGHKFIFTNGTTIVQVSSGGNTATNLSTGLNKKAKYCIPYANRLFIAYYGASLDPLGVAWSAEGDPTNWSDSTAGAVLLESKDFITGLGVVGGSLVIYKSDSIAFGHRTGVATAPISLPQTRERRGIGCVAPYSIVDFMGTNAFIGRNDFYVIEGDYPVAIGDKIRDKFFDIVNLNDIKKVYGFENNITNELCWIANIAESEDTLMFAWDYKLREWNVYDFALDFITAGKGSAITTTT